MSAAVAGRVYEIQLLAFTMEVPSSRRAEFSRRMLCGFMAAGALAVDPAVSQEWKPQKNVDIVVIAAAGGAADRQARVAQRLLQSLPEIPSVTVTNRPGGGGAVALTFLAQHPGDGHYLASLSTTLLTNQIIGVSPIRYQDLTPLNILMREYVVLTVKADSPLGSGKDLIARLKKDPASVSFAFSSARGNQNHVVIGMIARAAGVDPKPLKTVVYNSGGQGATAVLGGHVDMLVGTPGTALPHLESGKAHVLGISAPQRQAGRLAGIPTLREQGIDAVYYSWRGFVGPKGLTPSQVAFWEQAFAKVIQGEEWKKDLEENAWAEDFRGSAETRKHLDVEYELLRKMLVDLGVVPR